MPPSSLKKKAFLPWCQKYGCGSYLILFISISTVELWSPDDSVQYHMLPARSDRIKRQAAHDHARDHSSPKVTKPNQKRVAKKNVPMDTVHKSHKQMISVDPAAFSCKSHSVSL